MSIFFLFLFIYIMVNFQNKNKVWINNTLKSNAETLDILKLLKDIGIFKEKPKKRKPKAKKEEPEEGFEDDDEFLQPPSGGGGDSDDMGGGSVTSNLLALKGALSAKSNEEENLKKLKEATELQLGKLRDAQQDMSKNQLRLGYGFTPSTGGPKIEFLDEEEKYFPPKEGVVSEPAQEFTEERSGTDIPQAVLDKDISPKVSAEQGQFEDEEEQGFETIYIPQAKSVEEQIKEQVSSITDSDKFDYLSEQYDLVGLARDANATQTKEYVRYLYDKFNIQYKKGEKTEISKLTMDKAKQKIKQLINNEYTKLQG